MHMIREDEKFTEVDLSNWLQVLTDRTSLCEQAKPVFKELLKLKYVYFDGQPNADLRNASYVVERFIEVTTSIYAVLSFCNRSTFMRAM